MMKRCFVPLIVSLLLVSVIFAQTQNSRPYATLDRGATFLVSSGIGSQVQVGYGRIQPNAGTVTPAAYAQFEFAPAGVTVSEATVAATPPILSGRIYAEVGGSVNTGVAIANPNAQPATVTFYLTNASGQNFGQGAVTIPAGGQMAKFLNEVPFTAAAGISGSFTFNSNMPIGVTAIRGLVNERGEFLITTLPISDLSASSNVLLFPHFADGGGWTTQVVLVNPTDSPVSGTVFFRGQGSAVTPADTLVVTVNGQSGLTFPYTIPARSSVNLRTSGQSSNIIAGSVHVTPASGSTAPSGLVIFTFRNGGVTVTEAGVPVLRSSSAFRLFIEERSESGSDIRQTGIAIANPGSGGATVNLELTALNGSPVAASTVTVSGNGQIALFVRDIPAFAAAFADHFHGVLRVTTNSPDGICVVALKGRYNARRDFLITTALASDENASPGNSELLFPHVVTGGGYLTEYVFFSGLPGRATSGTTVFFNQSGQPANGF